MTKFTPVCILQSLPFTIYEFCTLNNSPDFHSVQHRSTGAHTISEE